MTANTPDPRDADLRRIARRRVKLKMGWYVHLAGGVRWSVFPALGWGLGLTIHGLVVALQLMGGGDLRERWLQQEIVRLRQGR